MGFRAGKRRSDYGYLEFGIMKESVELKNIQQKIFNIRGLQVMLDSDLAELYDTETKFINRAVKRNPLRFPEDFMFELTKKEFESLRTQFTASKRGGRRY